MRKLLLATGYMQMKFVFYVSSLFLCMTQFMYAQSLTSLAKPPMWSKLDVYNHTMSRADFEAALDLYITNADVKPYIQWTDKELRILKRTGGQEWYTLKFNTNDRLHLKPYRYWITREERQAQKDSLSLEGLHIAIDPGHIGGVYAQMEHRWFRINDDRPISEGDIVLAVGRLLKQRLESLGAKVLLIRNSNEPVTRNRPENLHGLAQTQTKTRVEEERSKAEAQQAPLKPMTVEELGRRIQARSNLLFYRVAEIRARAHKVNTFFRPDLVIALHLNAAPWPQGRIQLVDTEHFHILVNGAYSEQEIAYDDVRFELMLRIWQRMHEVEHPLAVELAETMSKENQLPPFTYKGDYAENVVANPYVWARNLQANRQYYCPVVYLEPYCMNGKDTYARLQMGDYEGYREINGKERKSLIREYVDGVVQGIVNYYKLP